MAVEVAKARAAAISATPPASSSRCRERDAPTSEESAPAMGLATMLMMRPLRATSGEVRRTASRIAPAQSSSVGKNALYETDTRETPSGATTTS